MSACRAEAGTSTPAVCWCLSGDDYNEGDEKSDDHEDDGFDYSDTTWDP
jgi:hypothetical protein